MDLLENIRLNIKARAKLLNEAENDPQLQAVIYEMCKRDPSYFFKYFVWTDRNPTLFSSEFGDIIPFILFDYQEEYLTDAWDAIKMGRLPIKQRTLPTDVFSEKSRQMGFSWFYAALQEYAFNFHNMKSLYLSMAAEEVDINGDIKSHFEKIRFIIRNLPSWMLPKGLEKDSGTSNNKYMLIGRDDGTGSIRGKCSSPSAGRGGTYDFVIFDEMAFLQYATAINTSVASATPCRFFNSTPNGEGNEYFKMRKLAIEGKIRYHRCHRSEHPLYTPEWYKWKISGMTKEQIAQELEIDYNVAIQGRVYPNFKGNTHDVEYDPTKPLFVVIDNSHGGADPNAVIIMQPNYNSQFWDIIDSVEVQCDIPEMANILGGAPKIGLNDVELAFFNRYQSYNWRQATFVSDPYDTHTKIVNNHHPDGIIIYEEYRKVGIHLNIPDTKNNPKTTQIMRTRSEISRLRVNPRCSDFISSIQNAKYPDAGATRVGPIDLPIHDWTSHYRTCLEYMTIYLLDSFVTTQSKEEKKKVPIEVKDPVTGQIIIRYI